MWIVLIAVIEIIRFYIVLTTLQQQGLFTGWLGIVLYWIVDWLFFYVVLEVLNHYLHIFPFEKWRRNSALGNWLRRRIRLTVRTLDNSPVPEHAVYAIHSHGIIATGQLLAFMMYPEDCPELGNPGPTVTATVSSQLWMFPLTSLVCRMLGARSISEFKTLVAAGRPVSINPGGAKEISLAAGDTDHSIDILERIGFLKLCYEFKRPVVPIFVIGNHTMYKIFQHPRLARIQRMFFQLVGYGLPIIALGSYGSIVPKAGASTQLLRLPTVLPENFESESEMINSYYVELQRIAKEEGKVTLNLSK